MKIAVVGAGISGLVVSLKLLEAGNEVVLIDHAFSVGLKWLLAGQTGINFSADYPIDEFAKHYGEAAPLFYKGLTSFNAEDWGAWLKKLGAKIEKGNGHRLLATGATPKQLLDNWVSHLASYHSFSLFTNAEVLEIRPSEGGYQIRTLLHEKPRLLETQAVVLACGGGSYPKTGSDGRWMEWVKPLGIEISPFQASNCAMGHEWSPKMKFEEIGKRFQHRFVKNVSIEGTRGDLVLTPFGVEGAPVYPHSAGYRAELEKQGKAMMKIDLLPDLDLKEVERRLVAHPQGKLTLSSWLQKRFSLSKEAFSLLMETTTAEERKSASILARKLKGLTLVLNAVGPIERAISTAGGVRLEELTDGLESKSHPNLFFCGEMLDFDAPTGGFLMQAAWTTACVVADRINKK